MTLPASEPSLKLVFDTFRDALAAMKAAENACGKFPANVLNEFRMAFYHVTNAFDAGETATSELDTAYRHCKRAYYDSREIEVLALLEIINDYDDECSGHEDIVKSHHQDFTQKRTAALEAQNALKEAVNTKETRDQHYKNYDAYCPILRDYCKEIKATRPAVLTAIRKHNHTMFFQYVLALAGLFTIIGVVVSTIFHFWKNQRQ